MHITVAVVGLRAALPAPLGRCLGRVSEMSAMAGALDLLHDIPPPRRPLQDELALASRERRQPSADIRACRRRDPTPTHLPRLPVERLVRDLPPVNIQRAYDPHQ